MSLYLAFIATPHYVAKSGFTVRAFEPASEASALGGFAGLATTEPNRENEMLFAYLRSAGFVAHLQDSLDLRGHFSRDWRADPLLRFRPNASDVALHRHWRQKSRADMDHRTGLIELTVRARTPEMADAILRQAIAAGQGMVNEINQSARRGALSFSAARVTDSKTAEEEARGALEDFRGQYRLVDPRTEAAARMGVLSALEAELARALVDQSALGESSSLYDPRASRLEDRIDAIRRQIAKERESFDRQNDASFAQLINRYDALIADVTYAEQRHQEALFAHDEALSEIGRQSRYLAVYVPPTTSDVAQFPDSLRVLATTVVLSFLAWSLFALVYISLRGAP